MVSGDSLTSSLRFSLTVTLSTNRCLDPICPPQSCTLDQFVSLRPYVLWTLSSVPLRVFLYDSIPFHRFIIPSGQESTKLRSTSQTYYSYLSLNYESLLTPSHLGLKHRTSRNLHLTHIYPDFLFLRSLPRILHLIRYLYRLLKNRIIYHVQTSVRVKLRVERGKWEEYLLK